MWQDKKVDEMTETELRQAVKDLRVKLVDTLKPTKGVVPKPPLGCKPACVSSNERIKALSEAITRQTESECNFQLIDKWAREIELQCKVAIECS